MAERNLFPGYVILSVSDEPECINKLGEILGRLFPGSKKERNGRLHAVCKNSRENLLKLCGNDKVIQMSRGRICSGSLVITDGPLAGYERSIRKIDRHKRTAWLEMPGDGVEADRSEEFPMFRRICVGLEVYEKYMQD